MKNIPIPSRLQYQKKLVEKGESFLGRLSWKLFNILNPTLINKQTYGFNTTNTAPQMKELKAFKDDFIEMLRTVQFRPVRNSFQTKLREDIKTIQQTNEIIVSADKSRNKYKIPVEEYKKLVSDNITKVYKKDESNMIKETNQRAKDIAVRLDIDDRVDQFIQSDAYVTVKDHKPNFPSKIECRLINPAKSNIGRVSKQILSNIVHIVRTKSDTNQWKNSGKVIDWFDALENKEQLTFFKFDVVSFYPSISKKLFDDSVTWAKQFYTFTETDLEVIQHARESYLFNEGQPWVKKLGGKFDVSIGGFDGAEVCELVGLYILSKLGTVINQKHIGLYRDDGLGAVQLPGPQVEKLIKTVFQIFKSMGLLVIEANLTATEFLMSGLI